MGFHLPSPRLPARLSGVVMRPGWLTASSVPFPRPQIVPRVRFPAPLA